MTKHLGIVCSDCFTWRPFPLDQCVRNLFEIRSSRVHQYVNDSTVQEIGRHLGSRAEVTLLEVVVGAAGLVVFTIRAELDAFLLVLRQKCLLSSTDFKPLELEYLCCRVAAQQT